MASIVPRQRWDGTTAFSVRWRDPKTRRQHRVTLRSEKETSSLARYLNDNGQIPAHALPDARTGNPSVPTVADLVQEHIDLLVRPSLGAIGTYQRILDLHIRETIGTIPVDAFGYRDTMQWLKHLNAKGAAPKSIHNMHGLLSAAMNTALLLGYVSRNPCRGVPLPTIERADDQCQVPHPRRVQSPP